MKKGFTLTELLAVIVIISVLSVVTVPIVVSYIEHAKYSAFENGVKSVYDTAKIYVSAYEENGDLPIGGIKVEELKKELKNYNYISGSIYRNNEGSIYIENISDGTYCASGIKSDLKIIKGDCDDLDSTPPALKVAINNITSSSAIIVASAVDNQSGILGYAYSLDGTNYSEISNKKIYEIKNLNSNQTITVYVRTYNNKYDKKISKDNPNYEEMFKNTVTEKSIKITTLDIEKPKFKISTTQEEGSTVKIVDIIYPKNTENYKYTYQLDSGEEVTVNGENTRLTIGKNCLITAKIYYNGKIISNEIYITGMDNEGPKAIIKYNTSWELSKKIIVSVMYEKTGLPERPYSFDGGHTWQKDNYKIYVQNETLKNKIMVRDKLGNITNKFKINNKGEETDEISFDYTDKVVPSCEIEATGTKKEDNWFVSNVNIRLINVKDYARYCVNGINCQNKEPGSGIKTTSLDTTSIKSDTIKKVTGTVVDNLGNKSTCVKEIKVDKTNPTVKYSVTGGIYNKNQTITITGSDKYIKKMVVNIYKNNKLVVNKTLTNVSNGQIIYNYTLNDGNWMVYTKVYDKSGRIQNQSPSNADLWYYQNYVIDTIKPTCSLKVTSGTKSQDWYITNVRVDFASTNGTGTNIKTSNISQNNLTNNGVYKIVGTVVDEANNSNTCSINVNVDKTVPSPPIITATDGLANGVWHRNSVTLVFKPNGNITSGVKHYEYNYNGKFGIGSLLTINENMIMGNLSVKVCNNAGICSSPSSYIVNVDQCNKTSPTYSNWSGCSKRCDSGIQSRTVTYRSYLGSGFVCYSTRQEQSCNTHPCVIAATLVSYPANWNSCKSVTQETYRTSSCHSGNCGPCSGGCSYEDGWNDSHNAWCSDCCCSESTGVRDVCVGGYECNNGGSLSGQSCIYYTCPSGYSYMNGLCYY